MRLAASCSPFSSRSKKAGTGIVIGIVLVVVGSVLLINNEVIAYEIFGCGELVPGPFGGSGACFSVSRPGLVLVQLLGILALVGAGVLIFRNLLGGRRQL